MKINRIILVGLLMAILTIGAVSASENTDISDTVASPQDIDVIADDDDEFEEFVEYKDGTGSADADIKVHWPSEIKVGDNAEITFDLPEDMESYVTLSINNERIDDGQLADNSTPYDVFIDEFGTNVLKLKFYGDSKYKPFTTQKTYNVNDYLFNVSLTDEEVIYGQDNSVIIDFPFDATGDITVAGVKSVIGDEDTSLTVPLKNLKIGTNQVQIKYSGDEKYFTKTVTIPVEVKAKAVYETYMTFDNVTFTLRLPNNAAGNLEITVDGNNVKTAKLTNGLAEIRFDGLNIGGHGFKAKYTGNDYACAEVEEYFYVIPNITINSFKTTKDGSSVKIRLPDGESGKLDVTCYKYETDGGLPLDEISKSSDVSGQYAVDFSNLQYGYYIFEVKYISNGGYYYFTVDEGFIRDPFSMNISAPEVVLTDEDIIEVNVTHPPTDGGFIELYVDGEAYDEAECEASGLTVFYIDYTLSKGNHKITAKFSGNGRYSEAEKSATIKSDHLIISVPEEISIGTDDEISIETAKDATGSLVVYVDGVEYSRKSIEDGSANISMGSLPFGSYSIKVAYEKGNYPAASVSTLSNVSYTFRMVEDTPAYGSGELYSIDVPSNLVLDKLVVKVDNITYPAVKKDGGIGINVSGLDMGSHTISVSYPGDDKFYPLSIEKEIGVAGKIDIPTQINAGEEKSMSLVLPKDPKGKLELYVYDERYYGYVPLKSFGFVTDGDKSIAEIPVSYLGIGNHKVKVVYTGDDYNITDEFRQISIDLNLTYDREVQYFKKQIVSLDLPNAEGGIEVWLDGDFYRTVNFVNGTAKIQFPEMEVGQHTFELIHEGVYSFDKEGMFVVYPIINVPTGTVIDGAKSITVNSGIEPVGTLIVYADGKKYKELDLDGDTQSISLGGLSNGAHKISVVYDSWDDMKYENNYTVTTKKASLSAKDMSMDYMDGSKFKVLVKDYKGKAVKKGQSVKFYVDGKLFKTVKTDSKGYASVSLTHAPGKHTVKAVYKASTISKKVTVKQIITLKKVAVKRSAKSLVLQATLKKVKGKYLKSKQIAFKFSGKTYKAVTNSKGVAKVTVPAKVLKKLKAGKTVTYQATYVKATVKQSVKVSK